MRKLIFLLILLPSVSLASSHKRLDSLAIAAYDLCNLNRDGTDQVADSVAYTYVNLAIQQVSSDFPAVQRSKAVRCTVGVSVYSVGDTAFNGLLWCQYWRKKKSGEVEASQYVLQTVSPIGVYEAIQAGKPISDPATDPSYAWGFADSIYIVPAPNAADTIRFGYTVSGLKLTSASDTTDVRPRFRHLIVLLTAARISQDSGRHEKAIMFMAEYEAFRKR